MTNERAAEPGFFDPSSPLVRSPAGPSHHTALAISLVLVGLVLGVLFVMLLSIGGWAFAFGAGLGSGATCLVLRWIVRTS